MTMIDPVTAYATAVQGGSVVASRLVRAACRRHLDDIRAMSEKGLLWRPEKAQEAIDFFAEVLCLPENTDATGDVKQEVGNEPQPFLLQPWQQFIVGSLFGWYTVHGFRRFREAYVETAKGSGKTPLGAGIMLYLLVADGERGAQIFAAAVTREQAGLAFRDAVAMVNASPALKALIDQRVNNLAVLEDGSFFRPVSSEKRGLDGKRVHGALIDELHEHATPIVVNKMRAGTKGRRSALIVKITNSGFDPTSVCWHHHEYSRKVLDGSIPNETWFAFICGLDSCSVCFEAGKLFPQEDCAVCDDWKTEGAHWLKANPNLGVSLPWQYVRERVNQAKGMTSEVSDVLRFNFCVWTRAHSMFLNVQKWQACARSVKASDLVGAKCYAGLDLGQSDDMSAFVRLWELVDGRIWIVPTFWMPSGAIERFPNRPYEEWQRLGALEIIENSEVIDYGFVEGRVKELCEESGVIEVAYDKRFAEQMAQNLTAAGITMVNTAQGFQLTEALRKLSDLISSETLVHDGNPIMSWQASNLVVKHGPNKTMRPDKEKAAEKIDGQVALIMGLDIVVRQPKQKPPEFQFTVFGAHP
jgi:phage terminase large subunit-like protein